MRGGSLTAERAKRADILLPRSNLYSIIDDSPHISNEQCSLDALLCLWQGVALHPWLAPREQPPDGNHYMLLRGGIV